ncbi:cation diffusion facilitator family transporter [Lachnotalea sp. AF33-28]|jgi:cation diffusion facilitator family transporter|uniref:cation diffusion facilitator family transporter n=1 Tax=Lachnotalea sp. AF33-28 TaxID=2292046 RepID=UPI000E4FF801|nr:cation diffusion facilitator family transporter [Lachnotalea sp. AF33-28]RHP34890.1 cation transporter [Lachnotalea sp. AF33-28]
MTELLVRKFVKDYRNTGSIKVRTAYGMLSSVVGIACNVLLFAVKLVTGMLIRSVSVMSDAFNNLSDAASSVISFVGIRMAEKPADADHPFGHGRIEYITTLIVSFLVLEVGWTFLKSSFQKILHPEELIFGGLSLCILLLSIGVKLWLSFFNRRLSKRVNSSVLKATAVDSMNDVLVTAATVGSILIYRFLHWNIDGYVGVVVSGMIMYAGFNIAKETVNSLIGEAGDPELYKSITEFVEGYDGIVGSHDLIVHNYGPSRSMASIHAEVPCDADIEASHEIVDRIERDAMRTLGIFLVIHMDPIDTRSEEVQQFRAMLEEVVKEECEELSFHDFRLVHGRDSINLIFDLVLPRSMRSEDMDAMKKRITARVAERDQRCHCVITAEKSYMGGTC